MCYVLSVRYLYKHVCLVTSDYVSSYRGASDSLSCSNHIHHVCECSMQFSEMEMQPTLDIL